MEHVLHISIVKHSAMNDTAIGCHPAGGSTDFMISYHDVVMTGTRSLNTYLTQHEQQHIDKAVEGKAHLLFACNKRQHQIVAVSIDTASSTLSLIYLDTVITTIIEINFIFYNLITQLVQAFQEFNGPFIITNGGPRRATTLMSILIYNNAFKQWDMGLASAQAWVLFIILMIFTAIAFWSQNKWVYYSDEEAR